MFDVGSVIINRNLFFKDSNKLDHAYKRGRPCLVIATTDEYYYYLSISNTRNKQSRTNIPMQNTKKLCSPSFLNIFKAPICYKEELFKISEKNLLDIYKAFLRHYNNRDKCEYYDEVVDFMINYINQNEKSK